MRPILLLLLVVGVSSLKLPSNHQRSQNEEDHFIPSIEHYSSSETRDSFNQTKQIDSPILNNEKSPFNKEFSATETETIDEFHFYPSNRTSKKLKQYVVSDEIRSLRKQRNQDSNEHKNNNVQYLPSKNENEDEFKPFVPENLNVNNIIPTSEMPIVKKDQEHNEKITLGITPAFQINQYSEKQLPSTIDQQAIASNKDSSLASAVEPKSIEPHGDTLIPPVHSTYASEINPYLLPMNMAQEYPSEQQMYENFQSMLIPPNTDDQIIYQTIISKDPKTNISNMVDVKQMTSIKIENLPDPGQYQYPYTSQVESEPKEKAEYLPSVISKSLQALSISPDIILSETEAKILEQLKDFYPLFTSSSSQPVVNVEKTNQPIAPEPKDNQYQPNDQMFEMVHQSENQQVQRDSPYYENLQTESTADRRNDISAYRQQITTQNIYNNVNHSKPLRPIKQFNMDLPYFSQSQNQYPNLQNNVIERSSSDQKWLQTDTLTTNFPNDFNLHDPAKGLVNKYLEMGQPLLYGNKMSSQDSSFPLARSLSQISSLNSDSTINSDKKTEAINSFDRKYDGINDNNLRQPQEFSSTNNPYQQNQQQQYNYGQGFEYFQNGPTTEAVPVLRQTNEIAIDGSFHYETLTGDQTHVIQEGHIENPGTENEEQVIHGSYSFLGDNGKTYTVNYVADSNGFRAIGDHLPTPPPVPEIIQKSIDVNLAEEANKLAQSIQNPQLNNANILNQSYRRLDRLADRNNNIQPLQGSNRVHQQPEVYNGKVLDTRKIIALNNNLQNTLNQQAIERSSSSFDVVDQTHNQQNYKFASPTKNNNALSYDNSNYQNPARPAINENYQNLQNPGQNNEQYYNNFNTRPVPNNNDYFSGYQQTNYNNYNGYPVSSANVDNVNGYPKSDIVNNINGYSLQNPVNNYNGQVQTHNVNITPVTNYFDNYKEQSQINLNNYNENIRNNKEYSTVNNNDKLNPSPAVNNVEAINSKTVYSNVDYSKNNQLTNNYDLYKNNQLPSSVDNTFNNNQVKNSYNLYNDNQLPNNIHSSNTNQATNIYDSYNNNQSPSVNNFNNQQASNSFDNLNGNRLLNNLDYFNSNGIINNINNLYSQPITSNADNFNTNTESYSESQSANNPEKFNVNPTTSTLDNGYPETSQQQYYDINNNFKGVVQYSNSNQGYQQQEQKTENDQTVTTSSPQINRIKSYNHNYEYDKN